jgi:hypothetical protein
MPSAAWIRLLRNRLVFISIPQFLPARNLYGRWLRLRLLAMLNLFRQVEKLVAGGAVHVRSGVGVNDTSDDLLMCLLYREVAELDTARMPHRGGSEIDELGDILTVLMRIAVRRGWSLDEIEGAAIRKMRQRYAIPAVVR